MGGEPLRPGERADLGETDQSVHAGVQEGDPVLPTVQRLLDVGLRDVGPADRDFGEVVGASAVGDDRDELAGAVKDPGICRGCPVAPEPQLQRAPVVVNEVPGVAVVDLHDW